MTLGGQHPLTQFADASDGGAVQLRFSANGSR
jgi:hypothetical protein